MTTKLSELNEYSQGFANGRQPRAYQGQAPLTPAQQALTRTRPAGNGLAISETPVNSLAGLGELVQVVT